MPKQIKFRDGPIDPSHNAPTEVLYTLAEVSDLPTIPSEPWQVENSNTQATNNTQDIYQNADVGIGDFSGQAIGDDLHVKTIGGRGIKISTTATGQTSPYFTFDNIDNPQDTILTPRDGHVLNIEYGADQYFEIEDTGQLQADFYGNGTFNGTALYGLGVQANGRIVETSLGGNQTLSTTTAEVETSDIIQAVLSPTADVHNNGATILHDADNRSDAGRSRTSNVFTYTGSPDRVKGYISFNAEDAGASNYRSRPKMRVLKGGNIIAVLDDLVMQQNTAYDGDWTLNGVFVDANPGSNPQYTFEWFDEDARTATLLPNTWSNYTLEAVNKITVLTSATLS